MQKYYWTKVYQVSKSVGYVKSGEKYCKMTTFKEKNIPYAVWTLTYYDKLILVEEIFPFLAREVKTGILFPILCLHEECSSEIKYKSYPFIPIHTFVGSTKDITEITYAEQVQTHQELEKYNQMYPDINQLNQELLNFIAIGKSNVHARFEAKKEQLKYERQQLEYKKQQINEQKQEKRDERLKVRKIERQFKQGRKNIK